MTSNIINYQSISSSQIFLHSDNADIYYNGTLKSSVEFFLKESIKLDKNTIECKVSVVNAQIPVSFCVLNNYNNNINITVNGITTPYYFPIGNYNVQQFITQWTTTVGNNWTLTFNQISNVLTFSYISNFTFSDANPNISMLNVIGFRYGSIYNSIGNSITAPFPVNFGLIPRLHIKSDTFASKNIDSFTKGRTRTLCIIPVNSPPNGMIIYNNFTSFKTVMNHRSVSSIRIDITDDFRNLIDFRNIDWSLTIQIDIVNDIYSDLNDLDDVYKNQIESLF
jgi:hypothetical protein